MLSRVPRTHYPMYQINCDFVSEIVLVYVHLWILCCDGTQMLLP